jgi:hypothetical protein
MLQNLRLLVREISLGKALLPDETTARLSILNALEQIGVDTVKNRRVRNKLPVLVFSEVCLSSPKHHCGEFQKSC